MMDAYTLDKAAHLLGVAPDRLASLVEQKLVETIDDGGEQLIPKSEIARLYEWFENPTGTLTQRQSEAGCPEAVPENSIKITDVELLHCYEEMSRASERLQSLGRKIHRLQARTSRLQAIVQGTSASFWERACALHPKLYTSGQNRVVKMGTDVYLVFGEAEQDDDFRERFTSIIREGISKGHLPPGFMGVPPEQNA